jgi:hypothetical protein
MEDLLWIPIIIALIAMGLTLRRLVRLSKRSFNHDSTLNRAENIGSETGIEDEQK